jgi:NDP-sugar pyrophosphorylase family protein
MREAIILAGGKSKRLKPFTDISKPLLKLNNKYLLDTQLEWLESKGFDHVIVAIDWETFSHWNTRKEYLSLAEVSPETDHLGTSGALRKAVEYVDSELVYVMNVDDILLDFEPSELYLTLNKSCIVVLHQPKIEFGVARIRDNTILRFQEKPYLKFWVSCGHYLFQKDIIKTFPESGNFEELALPKLAKDRKLQGYKYKGRWYTINSLKDIEKYLSETETFIKSK